MVSLETKQNLEVKRTGKTINDQNHGLRTPGEEIAFHCTAENQPTPTPRFLGTAKAYFVCHIDPKFQVSLIYAFIGCL